MKIQFKDKVNGGINMKNGLIDRATNTAHEIPMIEKARKVFSIGCMMISACALFSMSNMANAQGS